MGLVLSNSVRKGGVSKLTINIESKKENMVMKKALLIVVLAVALTFAFAASALADHSPSFYVEWQTGLHESYGALEYGNPVDDSPHSNYLEGTEKCGVCHAVHRAPVPGVSWDTSPSAPASRTPVAGGKYDRQEFAAPVGPDTQMLLQTNVANSCDYCHITTSVGGKQLYAGKTQYRTEGTGLAGAEWDAGFAHHNGCTGCHAVHGVAANYGNVPEYYGDYGTFQGPMASAVLKTRTKGAGGAGNQAYVWQDEVIKAGSAGIAGLASSSIPGMGAWAGLLTADDVSVSPMNVPLFPSAQDAVAGTNVRPDADAADAQVSAFCTFCHQNYGYASEAVVNPDGDRSLFQGPWYALAGTVPNVTGAAGTWVTMNGSGANTAPFKNHPVKSVDGTFTAAGKSASVPAQVAWADASTCRSCHDAGVEGVTGVIVQSYPHFTPGYFHFTKSAAHAGAAMTYAPPVPDVLAFSDAAGIAAAQAWLEDPVSYEEALTVADGQCLKCHVNTTNDAGVGKTY